MCLLDVCCVVSFGRVLCRVIWTCVGLCHLDVCCVVSFGRVLGCVIWTCVRAVNSVARGKGKVLDFVPMAKAHHGDIVSWEGARVESEEDRRALIREGVQPYVKRKGEPTGVYRDPVTWAGTDGEWTCVVGCVFVV